MAEHKRRREQEEESLRLLVANTPEANDGDVHLVETYQETFCHSRLFVKFVRKIEMVKEIHAQL